MLSSCMCRCTVCLLSPAGCFILSFWRHICLSCVLCISDVFLTVLKGVVMVGVNISVTLLCQSCSFRLDDEVQAISCYVTMGMCKCCSLYN